MPTFHSVSSCVRCGSHKRIDPNAPARDGKAISARNATSHGLFARDVVLPHLGEDPAAYNALLSELLEQIAPANVLERHYVEKIAAGTWRLRRLHRWQAQIFEDAALDEGERLDKLDKVLRHETALHRQIDSAVKMLNKDVAQLFTGRAHAKAIADLETSALECKEQPAVAKQIEYQTRYNLAFRPFPADDFDLTAFDNVHTQKCQNETAEVKDASLEVASSIGEESPGTIPNAPMENCQNEQDQNCQNERRRESPLTAQAPKAKPAEDTSEDTGPASRILLASSLTRQTRRPYNNDRV